jgi:hypothetical protein
MFKTDNRAAKLEDWKIGATIEDGARNNTLTSVGGTLVARDLPQHVVLEMLRVINIMMCYPPLKDDEVIHISESIERYRNATGA